jgi:hypothetical protein
MLNVKLEFIKESYSYKMYNYLEYKMYNYLQSRPGLIFFFSEWVNI